MIKWQEVVELRSGSIAALLYLLAQEDGGKEAGDEGGEQADRADRARSVAVVRGAAVGGGADPTTPKVGRADRSASLRSEGHRSGGRNDFLR